MTDLHQRPALDLLAELRRGKVHSELTDEIHQLLAACTDTGKKGSITLTLNFERDPDSDDESPRFKVTDSITSKKPRRTVAPSIFFVTDGGNLQRRDPREDDYQGLTTAPDLADDNRDARQRDAGD